MHVSKCDHVLKLNLPYEGRNVFCSYSLALGYDFWWKPDNFQSP